MCIDFMKASRPLIRVLVINDNDLWINDFIWDNEQNSVALSTAEAEYISAESCCAQLLWMKQTLLDFGVKFDEILLLCDNESAVKIATNPVQHSRTKYIDIRHHFLRNHVNKGDIKIYGIGTDY